MDFLVPAPNARLRLVEAKAGRTFTPAMAAPMLSLSTAMGKRVVEACLVPRLGATTPATRAVAPGVTARTLAELTALIAED